MAQEFRTIKASDSVHWPFFVRYAFGSRRHTVNGLAEPSFQLAKTQSNSGNSKAVLAAKL